MRDSESFRKRRRGSTTLGLPSTSNNLLYLKESLPDRYECICRFCEAQYEKSLLNEYRLEPSHCEQLAKQSSIRKLEGENCYAFVLDRLLDAGSYKSRGLAICVPDTVLFESSGPRCIIVMGSSREDNWKIIRQKEKLTYLQIRKFLDERRKKYNREIKARTLQLTSFTLQTKEMASSANNSDPFAVTKQLQQKLWVRDPLKESTRSKLDNYISVRTHTNRGSSEHPQAEELNRSKKQKELCLISYRDSTTQIIGPQEYAFLFERRKIDPYWSTVAFLQNVVKAAGSYQYKEVRYKNCRIADPQLFQRARRQVAILTENYSREQFVAAQDEQQFRMELRSSSEPKYLLYCTYKIVHFLEVQGITIFHCNFYFLRDVLGSMYFIDCSGMYYSRRQLSTTTTDLSFDQSQQLQAEHLKRKSDMEEERNAVRKICVDMLANALELRKIQLKLDAYENPSRSTVQKIFRLFHPQFESNLSQIISSVNWRRDVEEEIDRVRQHTQYLIHNSEGLKILHLHGIYFTKTLSNAKPATRTQSASLSERRKSLPLFSNNFRPWRNTNQRNY